VSDEETVTSIWPEGAASLKGADAYTIQRRPLHVLVADALGWQRIQYAGTILLPGAVGTYTGYPPAPGVAIIGQPEQIPRYDTDWSATGPHIGRLKIRLSYSSQGRAFADHPSIDSEAQRQDESDILPAVCRLILALAEAGKLPK